MLKQEYEIGDNVETYCETCDVVRSQIVESVGAKKQITRTSCPDCENKNRFKKSALGANKIRKDSIRAGRPYNTAQMYRKGEIIKHDSFGFGEVVNVIETGKIEVLFNDRLRCLIHNRSV